MVCSAALAVRELSLGSSPKQPFRLLGGSWDCVRKDIGTFIGSISGHKYSYLVQYLIWYVPGSAQY